MESRLGLGLLVAATILAAGCGKSNAGPRDDGASTQTTLPAARTQALAALQTELDGVSGLDAAGFAARYAVPFTTGLGYAPATAKGLDRVTASSFALTASEKTALDANGFVVSGRKYFPSFIYGYQAIYTDDLPVYVSADSILYAVHESFDRILLSVENETLFDRLTEMLSSMRTAIAAGAGHDISDRARADVDVWLSVASSLLRGTFDAPVAGGDGALARSLFEQATAASGSKDVVLFGLQRTEDFSQFKPRGHYTESLRLQAYFRATMWLGRIDFRLLETQSDGKQIFRRNQLEAAYVVRAAMDSSAVAAWKVIDGTTGAFVGEPDNMTLPQLDALLADLRLGTASDLKTLPDATVAQALVNGQYGAQRISSHIMINGLGSGTLPLSSTFLLLGQRYVLDSHVFSNVVYDRVAHGTVKRMMPSPLDVAFAALDNDQAGALLGEELGKFPYAPDLASMRVLADAHPQEYWHANLYNEWLSALRSLSPTADVGHPADVGLPGVAATEPWGRRILQTQLASWAELRHDTILYVKQSYTGGAACEYPDAYVDPYPDFFAKIASFAARGKETMAVLPSPSAARAGAYFEQLRTVAGTLESMAKNQRTGAPHSAEQLAFINQMTFQNGCGTPSFDGWYARLFFEPSSAVEYDPVVADVHTQPTDEAGNVVGRVLHVATAQPRAMVVTVESCSGPRAYVGLVSGYAERTTENFQRLDDEAWAAEIRSAPPAEVPWYAGIVQR